MKTIFGLAEAGCVVCPKQRDTGPIQMEIRLAVIRGWEFRMPEL